MNAAEHHQQELEQQQFEQHQKLMEGESDYDHCDGCITHHPVLVTRWTVEGFRLRYGEEAESLLKRHTGVSDYLVEDAENVCLCHDCEWHTEDWA